MNGGRRRASSGETAPTNATSRGSGVTRARPSRAVLALTAMAAAVVVTVGLLSITAPVAAHVPGFAGENTAHDRALHLENGAVSRSLYADLDRREARYYEVHLEAGEPLRASVFTPNPGAFTPSFVVYGPAVAGSDATPEWVAVPDGMGTQVVTGSRTDRAAFEPFTPAAYYQTAAVTIEDAGPGTYWIAVYDAAGECGQVGLAVGYEEAFTPVEYLRVPIDVFRVHLWEGDTPIVLVGPVLVGVLGVGWYLRRRWGDRRPGWRPMALGFSGALLLGGALLTAIQLVGAALAAGIQAAAILTLAFALVPAAVGTYLSRLAACEPLDWTARVRAKVVLAALLGLVTWGGVVLGPALALFVGLLPRGRPQ